MTEHAGDERVPPRDLAEVGEWLDQIEPVPDWNLYLSAEVGFAKSFTVARLLVPEFEVVRGCTLIRNDSPLLDDPAGTKVFDDWWASTDGNIAAIEAVLNHRHVWDLFDDLEDDPTSVRAAREFAQTMALTWRAALARDFPDRRFEVAYDPEDYGPTVTFFSH